MLFVFRSLLLGLIGLRHGHLTASRTARKMMGRRRSLVVHSDTFTCHAPTGKQLQLENNLPRLITSGLVMV